MPVSPPDTRPANEQGDVDVIFNVKEKRTGNVNFGASVGQGLGVGGFIGLDQPNLFGRCKRGSLQWQFGRYVNDFNLSYSDPSLRQTRISGTVSAYRSQARYTVADLGRSLRTGGSVELGFPIPRSPLSRRQVTPTPSRTTRCCRTARSSKTAWRSWTRPSRSRTSTS